jgi:acyl-CoA thioesterase FadM
LYVTTRVLEIENNRVRLFHSLHRIRDDALIATAEQLYVHVSTAAGKAAPLDPGVRERLARVQAAAR